VINPFFSVVYYNISFVAVLCFGIKVNRGRLGFVKKHQQAIKRLESGMALYTHDRVDSLDGSLRPDLMNKKHSFFHNSNKLSSGRAFTIWAPSIGLSR